MEKMKQFSKIFDEIYHFNVCGDDSQKVRRKISKTNVNAKVMVIAEAMAPEQVRLSGVNYFYKDGRIGNTGKSLEKFLNLFNHSVYPEHTNCVYHTEIVHNFPGYTLKRGKKTIKRPNKQEIKKSVNSGILEQEINALNPKIILLMGRTAYETFYNFFLKIKPVNNLTDEIKEISTRKSYQKYTTIPVIPIQHSSGANPRYNSMLTNENLIQIIRNLLKEKF